MATTPDLGWPLIATQQSQPEVTHNQALLLVQALLVGAISQTNTPPGSPVDGDLYIVGTAPTGAWAGRANKLALRYGGAWQFVPGVNSAGTAIAMGARHEGLRVYSQALNALMVWTGSAWVAQYALTAGVQAAIPDATGGSTVDAEARAAVNAVLAALRAVGVVAP